MDEENRSLIQNVSDNNEIVEKFNFMFSPYKRALPTKNQLYSSKSNLTSDNFKSKSFFSTPNFINDLTDISIKVVKSP
jgi:hypothetical protein